MEEPGYTERQSSASRSSSLMVQRATSVFVEQPPGDGACLEAPVQVGGTRSQRRNVRGSVTAECVRFTRKEMLRGTKMAGVLKGFGSIFTNSQGSAATFELSCPVKQIDVFISHNWSTRRLDKFGALALYFNWSIAFWSMWAFALASVPLGRLGAPFALDFESSTSIEGVTRQNITACCLGPVVLLLAFAGGHEFSGRMGCQGVVAFLDKTCIHQTDAQLKQEGIASLAAFLANSHTMVIAYSSTYLQKLWTVYELASSLLLHPGRKVVLIPCFMPKVILCGGLFYTAFIMVHRMLLLPSIAGALRGVPGMSGGLSKATTVLTFVIMFCMGYSFLMVLEDWARDRAEIKEVVQCFSIRNAVCFDEKDRVVVQSNIVSFVRDLDLLVAEEAEEDQDFHERALNAFDELVREEVPPALLASFGRQGIPYGYVLIMFSSQILRGVDVVGAKLIQGEPLGICALVAIEYFTVWMALCPLGTAAVYFIAERRAAVQSAAVSSAAEQSSSDSSTKKTKKKRRKRPLKQKVCLAIEFVPVMLVVCAIWFCLTTVSEMCEDGNAVAIAVFAAMVTTLFLLVAFAYRPVQIKRSKRNSLSGILDACPQDAPPLSMQRP